MQVCDHWVYCDRPKGPGCGTPGDCAIFLSDPTNAHIIYGSPVPYIPSSFCATDGSFPTYVTPPTVFISPAVTYCCVDN